MRLFDVDALDSAITQEYTVILSEHEVNTLLLFGQIALENLWLWYEMVGNVQEAVELTNSQIAKLEEITRKLSDPTEV